MLSSAIGSAAVLLVIFFDRRYDLHLDTILSTDLPIVLILIFSIMLVIIPGQILNSLLQKTGTIRHICTYFESFQLSRVKMASLIVLGIAPMLESITGFGVSLFFTVPILIQLFSIRKALLLSLLSINIMPWGTLALSTLVGAQVSAIDFQQLAKMTSLTSSAVFPCIAVLVFVLCHTKDSKFYSVLPYPLLLGFVMSGCLVFYNQYITAELAGVYSGLTTTIVGLLVGFARAGWRALSKLKQQRPPLKLFAQYLKLFAPYLILITLISLSQITLVHQTLKNLWVIQNGNVKLSVFTNPGIFIALTVLLLYLFFKNNRLHTRFVYDGVKRSVYPILGIMMFIVFSQLYRTSGIFTDMAVQLTHLKLSELTFASTLIGMFSGYLTGSNIGGNILLMPLQSEIGNYFNLETAFAALQNSSSGHSVFMSLPIILLTLSIAGTSEQVQRHGDVYAHQPWLVQRALLCAPLIYAALVIPFYLLT